MPLSGAEQAAWAGVLSARRGGKALPTAVQTALVAFFADPPCVGRRCRCTEGRPSSHTSHPCLRESLGDDLPSYPSVSVLVGGANTVRAVGAVAQCERRQRLARAAAPQPVFRSIDGFPLATFVTLVRSILYLNTSSPRGMSGGRLAET